MPWTGLRVVVTLLVLMSLGLGLEALYVVFYGNERVDGWAAWERTLLTLTTLGVLMIIAAGLLLVVMRCM